MTPSIQEMQWVLRAQCSDREALEALLRSSHRAGIAEMTVELNARTT